jgi:hypothetical protein
MLLEIGIAGLGLLASISVIFGLVAQLVIGQRNHWTWLVGAVAWFVGGLFASEVIWGTLTVNEIQPIIDGLALDESLLGGVIAGTIAVIAARILSADRGDRRRLVA